ncbi:TetR/AcrR family transcriptional regulator [Mariniluteicoccus endophyticus]
MPRPLIPERRRRILDVAEAMVLDVGFDAMTVAEVAARVGIGKGAVYLEFESKDAIVDELLRRSMRRLAGRVRRAGPPPGLGEAYRRMVVAMVTDRLMSAALLDDRAVLGSYVAQVEDNRYRARHVALVAYVVALQEGGALRPDVDPGAVALALSAAMTGFLTIGRIVGVDDPEHLEGAADALALMVSSLETGQGEVDPGAWMELVALLGR